MRGDACSKVAPLLVNMTLLSASMGIGMAGVETFLRLQYPVGSVVAQLDERLLHKLIPGARKRFIPIRGNGGSVLVKVDRRGFRGDGFSEPRRGPRAIVYGDSFVEGEFSPLEQTFAARLQSELRARSNRSSVEVVNAGVAGYGPDQAALRIEDEIGTLRPDVIVMCVFVGNDFGDLLRNRLFRLGAGGELVDNHPILGPEIRKIFDEAQRVARRPAIVRAVRTTVENLTAAPPRTSFPHYVDNALAAQKRDYREFVEERSDVVTNLLWDSYDADVALDPQSPSARYKIALMARVLARIDDTTRAHGVPWLLVIIPDPIDVAVDFELKVDTATHRGYDSHRLTSLVARAAEASFIPYVNLYETLREKPGERLFFRFGDNHWNAAGQARAASTVARALARQGWPTSDLSIASNAP
jgi:lysophospholipase L1-like esterase